MAERRNDMGIHRGLDEYERLLLTASLAIILLGSGMLAGCLVITTRLHGVNTTDKIIFWVVAVIMMLSPCRSRLPQLHGYASSPTSTVAIWPVSPICRTLIRRFNLFAIGKLNYRSPAPRPRGRIARQDRNAATYFPDSMPPQHKVYFRFHLPYILGLVIKVKFCLNSTKWLSSARFCIQIENKYVNYITTINMWQIE
jgi:hypothetical protein